MTTKHLYEIRYRIRPLGLIVTALAPEIIKHDSVELEALDEIDALTEFSRYMVNLNLEESGYTNDILDVVKVK